jgi:hypothetical protein
MAMDDDEMDVLHEVMAIEDLFALAAPATHLCLPGCWSAD